jgi:hypothetical protein
MRKMLRVLICAIIISPMGGAFAQVAPATAPVASQISVRATNATPLVGEEVVGLDGVLSSAYFVESRICTIKGCRSFIFDKRSGALIKNDRVWSSAYALTGRGRQVIRVKTFTEAERPLSEPPSDTALDTAPAISKVTRPAPKKKT